jgi:hypothetical protein
MKDLFWDSKYKETTIFGAGCLAFLFGFLVSIAIAICRFAVSHAECVNTAEIVGTTYEWRVFGGCFLEFDGQMIPEDVWQFFTFGNFQYDGVEIYK